MTQANGNDEKLRRIHEAAKDMAEVPTVSQLGDSAREALSSQSRRLMDADPRPLPASWLDSSHAPLRHASRTDFRGDKWLLTGKKLTEQLGTGFLVVLLGKRSCGKTQLGVELVRKAYRYGSQGLFCKAFELFITLRNAHNECADRFIGALGRLLTDPLLVIDQFEMRTLSQFDYEMLNYFLDKRYEALRDTLICSNHSEAGFADEVDPSVVARIRETGEIIICEWEKFR